MMMMVTAGYSESSQQSDDVKALMVFKSSSIQNDPKGEFPSSFISCSSLESLNIRNNQISGNFLYTVVSNLTMLKYLYLPINNITGSVPLSLTRCDQLQELDLSSNVFTGELPSGFCSSLKKILLSNNLLSGNVLLEIGKYKNLQTIDLSLNNLSGSIPSEIWTLPRLSKLVMWGNKLIGVIPESVCG
ncbi:hypothetical protein GIB67_008800 [Kingdonia uniflora]|uniref:Uncharacterized protein n=1 Tax=Kingdonia uniflora TaxID=39325 RepID=A0A7J7MHR6_9MAGN|nr:hypothetical protein GIB67_008800 [Kingdonia uniflora]